MNIKKKKLDARHGIICAMPQELFGYFGWPTAARLENKTVAVVASGFRAAHLCPFGRTIISISHNNGTDWNSPRIINDTPIDDRDAGLVHLGGNRILVTWFSCDIRRYMNEDWAKEYLKTIPEEQLKSGMQWITDDTVKHFEFPWAKVSDDGGMSWGAPVRTNLCSPHGPIRLKNGYLLYFGKERKKTGDLINGKIAAESSSDEGRTWKRHGEIPLLSNTIWANYHEAHVVELADGHLIGMIRFQSSRQPKVDIEKSGFVNFSILQTESKDGGITWAIPIPLGFHGSPPHIIRHSSGILILSYGYRLEPYGQRIAFSYDNGKTWENDWILRDDGPDLDLGYPTTVELDDKTLLSVYYQKPSSKNDKCALLFSKWKIPDEFKNISHKI